MITPQMARGMKKIAIEDAWQETLGQVRLLQAVKTPENFRETQIFALVLLTLFTTAVCWAEHGQDLPWDNSPPTTKFPFNNH